jgi:RNA polymerase sigma-70 factor (ECF subfamily)
LDEASAELVVRWREGDEQAADELFRRYAGRLLALAQSRLSNKLALRVDAEDVVQSVYRSFFMHARAGRYVFERSGDLWKLLVAITLNKVRGQAEYHAAEKRDVARDQPVSEQGGDWQGMSVSVLTRQPTPAEAAALADELELVMRRLDAPQRRMFEMRLQGYSLEEIAAECGCSIRTVKRGLSHIRKELEAWQSSHQP